MSDDRTNDLVDGALADEIELVSDLVVAASTSPRHFTPDEVDALLGIGIGIGTGTGTEDPESATAPDDADG